MKDYEATLLPTGLKGLSKSESKEHSCYAALSIKMEGKKEIMGLWVAPTEGTRFWLGVMTELKNREVKDLFIASIDGLKGLPEAIETVFPEVEV